MGGLNASIVLPDADVEAAAKVIAGAAMGYAGQKCTATGRVLLAAQPVEMWPGMLRNIPLTAMTDRTVTDREAFRRVLEQARDQGWSLVDQELEKGLMSIAVLLRDPAGRIVGAINVGVPTIRMTPEEMVRDILPRLQETVAQISQALKR